VQGPDVGIGTTVEDVEELPPRSAARRRRRFRAALASVPRSSMPPQLLRPASHLRATLLAAAAALVPCIRRSGPPRSIPLAPPR